MAVGYLAAQLIGDAFGSFLAATIGFVAPVRFMLGTSFFGAIGISLVAIVLALVSVSMLDHLGVITTM